LGNDPATKHKNQQNNKPTKLLTGGWSESSDSEVHVWPSRPFGILLYPSDEPVHGCSINPEDMLEGGDPSLKYFKGDNY